MSSTSSQELAVSVSGSSEPECEPSDSWSLTPSAGPSSQSTGPTSGKRPTSTHPNSQKAKPTLFAEGSPARTFLSLDTAPALPAAVQDSGGNYCVPFAWYDRGTQSWRTWQLCLETGWAPFLGTWPRSGMTRNGIAYQRRQLERCTIGTEFGYRLIPTPTACDHKGSGRLRLERGENNNLRDWFKIKFGFLYPPVAAAEYLMGFPTGHTDLKHTEMPLSHKSRKSSGEKS